MTDRFSDLSIFKSGIPCGYIFVDKANAKYFNSEINTLKSKKVINSIRVTFFV